MPKKKSEHYVNNKELLEAMIVYRTKVEKSYMKTFNKDLTEFPKQERGTGRLTYAAHTYLHPMDSSQAQVRNENVEY